MYFCSILVFSHTQPFSCYFGPEPLTWYWACSSFSGFERQAALIQPQMVDVSKIIFSTTTDIRTTLESKRRTKCKLICQRTFCSMGMQSFICPCKFQDNFHIFCSSAGGFYQLMSAAWYTEKNRSMRAVVIQKDVLPYGFRFSQGSFKISFVYWPSHTERTKWCLCIMTSDQHISPPNIIMSKILFISKCHINTI